MHTSTHRALAVHHLKLPFGGPRQVRVRGRHDQLGLEHGIKMFSAHPKKNLLAVLEEWLNRIGWLAYGQKDLNIGSTNPWNV